VEPLELPMKYISTNHRIVEPEGFFEKHKSMFKERVKLMLGIV